MKYLFKDITPGKCKFANGFNFKIYFLFKVLQAIVQLLHSHFI